MRYASVVDVESRACAGVRLRVKRMSFGRRVELLRRVHEAAKRLAFLRAGEASPETEAEAALAAAEIDREYLRWGLAGVEGLEIDGEAAGPDALIERGPEELVREALEAVRREAGLSENERKNSESHSTSMREAEPGGVATSAGGSGGSGGGDAGSCPAARGERSGSFGRAASETGTNRG